MGVRRGPREIKYGLARGKGEIKNVMFCWMSVKSLTSKKHNGKVAR